MEAVHRTARKAAIEALGAVLLAVLFSGCPQKPVLVPAPDISGAGDLIEAVRARGSGLDRLDASLEVRLLGPPPPWGGRFFGSLRVDRAGPEELAVRLQAYTISGLPVLEVTTVAERVLVYSPMTRSAYFNFTEIQPGGPGVERLSASSYQEIALPVEMITDQLKLLWGMSFPKDRRYELYEAGPDYVLTQWSDEESGAMIERELIYSKDGLNLASASIYTSGILSATMRCDGYKGEPAFIPGRIELEREAVTLELKLSRLQVNSEVVGPEVTFELPDTENYVLLTPPVP